MKLIFLFTFAIGFFATVRADNPYDVGYALALGFLEFFLKLGNEDVSRCYAKEGEAYEKSMINFLDNLKPIKLYIQSPSTVDPYSLDLCLWGWNEMNNIANSLNSYFINLRTKILNGKVTEGGKVICNERDNIEDHYKQYKKHGNELKERNEKDYNTIFKLMDKTIMDVFDSSKKVTTKLLECFQKKGIHLLNENS